MACARVPLDEQQVTEPGPIGKERTLPALVSSVFCLCLETFDLMRISYVTHFCFCSPPAP